MAVILDPKAPVAFTPSDQRDKPEAARIVYALRPPTLYDRVQLEAAIARRGGRQHWPLQLVLALRRDVAQAMADSPEAERATVLGLIDAQRERLEAFYAQLRARAFDLADKAGQAAFVAALAETEAAADSLAVIEQQARALGGAYACALADNATYHQILGIEAARLFLAGWQGIETPFARTGVQAGGVGGGGVGDATLMAVPPQHFAEIGAEVQRLLRPSEDEEKNSAGPSSGDSAASPSTASKAQPRKSRSPGRTAAPTARQMPGISPGSA